LVETSLAKKLLLLLLMMLVAIRFRHTTLSVARTVLRFYWHRRPPVTHWVYSLLADWHPV